MVDISKLYDEHIGIDLAILALSCEFIEIDKLRSEKGEFLGYDCLLKFKDSDIMSTACQETLDLAIKMAALKARGLC